ncbi:MAG: hypothetical protein R3B68_09355 [Phycisphaerales bacterium]
MTVGTELHNDASHVGHIALPRKKQSDPHATRWGKFLSATMKFEASDLIMKTGQAPKIRLRGALKPLDTSPVDNGVLEIARNILTEGRSRTSTSSARSTSCDYDEHCFRVSLFMARGRSPSPPGASSTTSSRSRPAPSADHVRDRHAAPGHRAALRRDQLGQSTTIASMLDFVSAALAVHIVCIEDPSVHLHRQCHPTSRDRHRLPGLQDRPARTGPREPGHRARRRDATPRPSRPPSWPPRRATWSPGTIRLSTTQTFSRIPGLFPPTGVPQVRKILGYQMRAFVYKLLPTLHEHHRIPATGS